MQRIKLQLVPSGAVDGARNLGPGTGTSSPSERKTPLSPVSSHTLSKPESFRPGWKLAADESLAAVNPSHSMSTLGTAVLLCMCHLTQREIRIGRSQYERGTEYAGDGLLKGGCCGCRQHLLDPVLHCRTRCRADDHGSVEREGTSGRVAAGRLDRVPLGNFCDDQEICPRVQGP